MTGPPRRREQRTGGALLEVRDLSVTFATRPGTARVDRLSYSVGHAETLAIVGESGSGKTVSPGP